MLHVLLQPPPCTALTATLHVARLISRSLRSRNKLCPFFLPVDQKNPAFCLSPLANSPFSFFLSSHVPIKPLSSFFSFLFVFALRCLFSSPLTPLFFPPRSRSAPRLPPVFSPRNLPLGLSTISLFRCCCSFVDFEKPLPLDDSRFLVFCQLVMSTSIQRIDFFSQESTPLLRSLKILCSFELF